MNLIDSKRKKNVKFIFFYLHRPFFEGKILSKVGTYECNQLKQWTLKFHKRFLNFDMKKI